MSTPETMPSIHVTMMRGIIRMVRAFHEAREAKRPFTMADACRVGTEGVDSEMGEMFIWEFAKDGLVSLTDESIRRIVSGDYASLWASTNCFLKMMGYDPIEPVPLDIA